MTAPLTPCLPHKHLFTHIPRALFAHKLRQHTIAHDNRYIEGSSMDPIDLERCAMAKARCSFVLSDKFSRNVAESDASTVLQALFIKRYIRQQSNSDVLQCLQVLRPESKRHFTSFFNGSQGRKDAYSLICIQEIKMKLLAQTCMCPGLVAMVANLAVSRDEPPVLAGTAGLAGKQAGLDWEQEYMDGCGYEVYSKDIPASFSGCAFNEVAQVVFEVLGACMFAIEIRASASSKPRIVLNPGSFVFPDVERYRIKALMLAEDDSKADLSRLGGAKAEVKYKLEHFEIARSGSMDVKSERGGGPNPGGRERKSNPVLLSQPS